MKDRTRERISQAINLRGYEYRLWDYQPGHSVLTLRATQPEERGHNIHITFETVFYVQMPTFWKRGDLRVATQDEHKSITSQLGLDESTARKMVLLTGDLPKSKVYILFHHLYLDRDVPPVY